MTPRNLFFLTAMSFCSLVHSQFNFVMLPSEADGRVDDIYFINPGLGFACDGGGNIHRITEQGDLIDVVYSNQSMYLRSIEFINPEIGFCGSLQNALLKTTDGGETWEEVELEFDTPGICGMQTFPNGRVIASGAWFGPGYYIESLDFGETWTYRDLGDLASALVDVYFMNDQIGWIGGRTGSGGVLLKTEDGGDTWNVVFETSTPGDIVWKIHHIEGTSFVYCAIDSNAGAESIDYAWSSDAGNTFDARHASDFGYTQDVFFFNEQEGLRTGCAGPFLATQNAGETWEIAFGDVCGNRFFQIENELYLGANSIYKHTGEALSDDIQNPIKKDLNEFTVYPNPSQGEVNLNFKSLKADHIKIHVYSFSGQHILELETFHVQAGENSLVLDLDQFISGLYNLVIKTNGGTLVEKVILE